MLDDLQSVDGASATLLIYLSRQLAGQRLLLVCFYHDDELAVGGDGERYPLQKVLGEMKHSF